MKVQGANASSRKTRALIKKAFAEIINEKKSLSKVTVTEIVKRADITRSTFYTHYDDIYDVAKDYQMETIQLLISDDLVLHSKEEIEKYFDDIIGCLKKNENTYKMLLAADESLYFLQKMSDIAVEKLYNVLHKIYPNNKRLRLTISFFMDGIMDELVKYFRNKSDYTLDELLLAAKDIFREIFY